MSLTWQPSTSIDHLRQRAQLIATIRDFFAARDVLEVETPLLCSTTVTNPYIQSIPAFFQELHQTQNECKTYYLQTSPEYAMKRLLAAGSGAIYQLSKAFRQGEVGRFHNPEFSMLEWYRIGFDHHRLMDEMDALLQLTLKTASADRYTYAALFQTHLGIDPHHATLAELRTLAAKNNLVIQGEINEVTTWLDVLMSNCIEPYIGQTQPCFIYDYPVAQAALARIQPGNPPTAARFEVYFKGIELANGFHELQDANEQRKRFELDLIERKQLGLNEIPLDEFFLAALSHSLPDCAGVALGIDRLIMLAIGENHIKDVLSFDFARV